MYGEILKNPIVFRLSFIQFISYFGSWFSNVAIYTLILDFEVSPLVNATVVSMYALPAILAPLNGAVVDKFLSKRFMLFLLFVELSMTLCYLMISDVEMVWLLMLFIYIRTTAAFLFFNSEMSILPQILKGEELKKANELHSIIWSVTYALGMALGGVAVDSLGIYNTIVLDSVLFGVAIALFFGIDIDIKPKVKESFTTLIREGFFYLMKNRKILVLILFHASVGLTAFDTVINLLTDTYYEDVISTPLAIGLLNGIRAVGLMVGPFIIANRVNRKNLSLFFILEGVMIILWAIVADSFYKSLFMMFFIGFFSTTLWSYTYTLLQQECDERFLGRVLAYNEMIFMGVTILVAIFSGGAFEAGMSLSFVIAVLGIGFLITALFYSKWYNFDKTI
jgi:MFS family permease